VVARIEPLLTVADLDAVPEDNNHYELIGGELYVSRAPGIPHQLIVHHFDAGFAFYLERNPIGRLVPGAGAVFSDYDAVIPDLVFVRNERWSEIVSGERFIGAPDLVIEVLSSGSENRRRDLVVKRHLYAKYGVQEYWVVDAENRYVLIYRLKGQTLEQVATLRDAADEITSPILPGFRLSLSAIFNL
jgi:Uma2 family endonuclease